MLKTDIGAMSTPQLQYLFEVTRRALEQAGRDQQWKRFDDAVSLLAAVDEELDHRAKQLLQHPTLF